MTTALILIEALGFLILGPGPMEPPLSSATRDATSVLVATRRMWCSLTPRVSDVTPVDSRLLSLVAQSPTTWCTAHLRVDGLTAEHVPCVSATFVQLRRISVCRGCGNDAVTEALPTMLARLGSAGTIREVVIEQPLTVAIAQALGLLAGSLERLELNHCVFIPGGDLRPHVRGMPRLRVLSIGFATNMTDDHLVTMLGDSPLLKSLSVAGARHVTGAFLARLPQECDFGMRKLFIRNCVYFGDAGSAHLAKFSGLDTFDVSGCSNVSSLPMTSMPPLTHVVERFLSSSFALTSCDVRCLRNVCFIPSYFLEDCIRLTTLDLSALSNVVAIGNSFLFRCQSLVFIDFSGMRSVSLIGDMFLAFCSNLRTLDLSAMTDVQSIGDMFLLGSALTRIRLSDALLQNAAVGDEHKLMHAETGTTDDFGKHPETR